MYAATSNEIDMPYNEESVNLSFGPLIETAPKICNSTTRFILLKLAEHPKLPLEIFQRIEVKVSLLETQKSFVQAAKERGVIDADI